MTPLTPERIRQIQVEVLMCVMMGGVSNTFEEIYPQYKVEISENSWRPLVLEPLLSGACLTFKYSGRAMRWSVTKDGEEFVKNYSAAKE